MVHAFSLPYSLTEWVWWVSVFLCLTQWDFVRALDLFCPHPLISLHTDCLFFVSNRCFFSLFSLICLCLGYCLFLHISSCFSFPVSSLNWACNVIQLLLCSLLCQNFHFLRKQWPPSAGNIDFMYTEEKLHFLHSTEAAAAFYHCGTTAVILSSIAQRCLSRSSGRHWSGIFILYFGGALRQLYQLKQDKNKDVDCPGSVPLLLSFMRKCHLSCLVLFLSRRLVR